MLRSMIAIASVSLLVVACNSSDSTTEAGARKNGYSDVPKTLEDSLYHEVMEGHDVGMAKMGKLRGRIDETKRLMDSLGKSTAGKANAAYLQSVTAVNAALQNADKEMNTWMETFKADSATNDKDLRIKYLQSEKEKVTVVKENILSALAQADSLLKK